jgi:hypothetical protein
MRAVMAVRAVLFDLGNTLVHYYTPDEFPGVLRRCLHQCAAALGWPPDNTDRDQALFERALELNRERADFAVHPLDDRLQTLFELSSPRAAHGSPFYDRPDVAACRLVGYFPDGMVVASNNDFAVVP